MKTLCIYVGKQSTHFFAAKTFGTSVGITVFVPKTRFALKTVCHQKPFACAVHTAFEFSSLKTTMGEALINLVHQYTALWDKQDAMYKDSSYKETK